MLHVIGKFLFADQYNMQSKKMDFLYFINVKTPFLFLKLNGEYSLSQYFKKSDCNQDILPSRNREVFVALFCVYGCIHFLFYFIKHHWTCHIMAQLVQ